MKINKKDSVDYGLFCIRLSKEERRELVDLLDEAKERLNKGKRDDEYVLTKNQILFEAVKLGLPKLKRDR